MPLLIRFETIQQYGQYESKRHSNASTLRQEALRMGRACAKQRMATLLYTIETVASI